MSEKQTLVDAFGRRVTNLRISLTDRCNFRCVYCMPPEGVPLLAKSRYLSVDEITRFVSVIGRLGVTRVRLTGGEPLLRKEVVEIVDSLRRVDSVYELSMTTNGSMLASLATPLKKAGLDRLNISLDSLEPERFRRVTLYSQFGRVRSGIDAALAEGFPVKLNVVVLHGISTNEIIDFARMASDHNIEVRFLEFMPLCGTGWRPDLVYPIGRVREIIEQRFDLQELPRDDKPAQTFSIAGGGGKVGFIAPLSEPFCENCSRIRISADGRIRPCLFSDYEVSIGDLLRTHASEERLVAAIRYAVANKPRGSQFADEPFTSGRRDSEVSMGPNIRSIGG
ncbi:MAG: GTP 3',8-cyclase MoaA [Candidatus Krumholzibacteria bacterium]|nr:GTP 3',8-cyclase MoaA [Candidatus Krumholzibacteria bacterium]